MRVGEIGMFSWEMRLVDDGILDSLLLGEVHRSLRAVLLLCGRRSGALDKVGSVGTVFAFAAAKMLGCDGCLLIGAVFWEIKAGRVPFALKGFLDDLGRVGDGTGRSSSSESSELVSLGCHRASAPPAAAVKIFRPVLGAFVAPLRRGESERDAMEIGDGSAISTSIGVPANIVCALPKGVRVLFFSAFVGSGELVDKSVRSVVDVKSESPLVLTDDSGISLHGIEPEPEKSLTDP